ncbi:hypothetical protein LABOLPEG_00043 [Pseudomonas phage phi 21A]|nr:hypothetical protein LABOLPEG_00043 [Pseudomonas phage phi 21A]
MGILKADPRAKYVIQRRDKVNGDMWYDCQNGCPSMRFYTASMEELLIRDLMRLCAAYPDTTYRVIQHVDFTPPTEASIKSR